MHEIKHDGFRTLLLVNDGKVQAFTRNGNDWTARYPRIVAAAEKMRCRSAVIDGEVIVQDETGRSDLTAVQQTIRWHPERLVFFAFDLPFLNDEDLRDASLEERPRPRSRPSNDCVMMIRRYSRRSSSGASRRSSSFKKGRSKAKKTRRSGCQPIAS